MLANQTLISKEEEFLKLNSEIDIRTKDLMEEVNKVMKQQASDQEQLMTKLRLLEDEESKFPKTSETSMETTYKMCKSEKDGELPQICITEPKNIRDEREFQDIHESPGVRNRSLKACHSANVSAVTVGQGLLLPGKLTRHKSEIKLRTPDDALPESLKDMGQENIIRFLKAKVKVLTEQLEIIQSDERKHTEKIKELQVDRDRVAEDRDKWIQQANKAKNVLVQHEQHASNMVVQMQNLQAENGHLKREVEKLRKELKQITQSSVSKEVRLNRSLEELEKLKASMRQAKQEEKDLKETHRKKIEELSGTVKRVDKQRIELLHAFKKQLVIIDNLKKQKGLVEAGKFVKSVEDDFMEFLDFNPGNS